MFRDNNLSTQILQYSFIWNLRGILFFVVLLVLIWLYIFYEVITGWFLFSLIVLFFIGLLVVPYYKQLSLMRKNQQARDQEANLVLDKIMAGERVTEFILYLRPFISTAVLGLQEQKSRAGKAAKWKAISTSDLPAELSHGDLETLLADEFWPPPVIGLGLPGEHFGVGRLPVSESQWQDTVLKLIQLASCIVVVPSHNEGTFWEIKQLIDQQLIYKSLFYVEPTRNNKDWLITHDALTTLGIYLPPEIQNDTDKQYIGSLFKCFTEKPVSIRVDIGYTLECSIDKVKISYELIHKLMTRQAHYEMLSQITKNPANEFIMIPPGEKTQTTGVIYHPE